MGKDLSDRSKGEKRKVYAGDRRVDEKGENIM